VASASVAPRRDEIVIDDLLKELGFAGAAAKRRARAVLEAARLTRPGKQAIASYKRDAASGALEKALLRVCGDACRKLAEDVDATREPVVVAAATCEVCGGSNNRRAALACARALRRNRVSDVLVVGGTPQMHTELTQLFAGSGVRLQLVDGTRASHSSKEAIANMNRAQLLVIWGSTPLRHAVSNLYTQEPPPHLRTITLSRRGIEALCSEIVRSYERKRRQ
jgi:hypothetical protein